MYLTVYANKNGEVLDYPGLSMLGRSGLSWMVPEEAEMIPLPKGASLVSIPAHIPVAGLCKSCCGYDHAPLRVCSSRT
jgi:hypothetical protein